jgi:hypothetical protein
VHFVSVYENKWLSPLALLVFVSVYESKIILGLPKGRTNNLTGRPTTDDPKVVLPMRLRRSLLEWITEYGGGRNPRVVVVEILEEFRRKNEGPL